MKIARLLQPVGPIGHSTLLQGPEVFLLTRGLEAKLQSNGTVRLGAPLKGTMAARLLYEGSLFIGMADYLDNKVVRTSARDLEIGKWIAHPFHYSLLAFLACSGDVEARTAITEFVLALLSYDQQCITGRTDLAPLLSARRYSVSVVYDVNYIGDFERWSDDYKQNSSQFSLPTCSCEGSNTLLNRYLQMSPLTEARLLPRMAGLLITNDGPEHLFFDESTFDLDWNAPVSCNNGLLQLSQLLAIPAEGGVNWSWNSLNVSHLCSLPGMGQGLIVPFATVSDGIRDLWYYLLAHSLGGVSVVDAEIIATDYQEVDLSSDTLLHLLIHGEDIFEWGMAAATLIGRCDMVRFGPGDSPAMYQTNLTAAAVVCITRGLLQPKDISMEEADPNLFDQLVELVLAHSDPKERMDTS